MPRGTKLSEIERAKIDVYRESGETIRSIAFKMNRSKTTVHNYLQDPSSYGSIKRKGAKPKLTSRDKRQIKRLALSNNLSCSQIKSKLCLNVTTRRVNQILNEDLNIKQQKMIPKPNLQPRHKSARLAFAEKYKFWDLEWRNVIFSDEKKFNLDGPDGFQGYWREKSQKERNRVARNFKGGSLMTWAAFGYKARSPICFITHKMNAENYIDLLDNVLIDFAEENYGNNFTFQQDNAAIHTARKTKQFLEDKNITVLDWPALSPDLNPIENLWGILSNNIYKNGTTFDTMKELKTAITDEWAKIPQENMHSLINSLPSRLNEVIINRGGHTHY